MCPDLDPPGPHPTKYPLPLCFFLCHLLSPSPSFIEVSPRLPHPIIHHSVTEKYTIGKTNSPPHFLDLVLKTLCMLTSFVMEKRMSVLSKEQKPPLLSSSSSFLRPSQSDPSGSTHFLANNNFNSKEVKEYLHSSTSSQTSFHPLCTKTKHGQTLSTDWHTLASQAHDDSLPSSHSKPVKPFTPREKPWKRLLTTRPKNSQTNHLPSSPKHRLLFFPPPPLTLIRHSLSLSSRSFLRYRKNKWSCPRRWWGREQK